MSGTRIRDVELYYGCGVSRVENARDSEVCDWHKDSLVPNETREVDGGQKYDSEAPLGATFNGRWPVPVGKGNVHVDAVWEMKRSVAEHFMDVNADGEDCLLRPTGPRLLHLVI